MMGVVDWIFVALVAVVVIGAIVYYAMGRIIGAVDDAYDRGHRDATKLGYDAGYNVGEAHGDRFGYALYGEEGKVREINEQAPNGFISFGWAFPNGPRGLGKFTREDAEAVLAARAAAKAKAEREEAERVVRLGEAEVERIARNAAKGRDVIYTVSAEDWWADVKHLYTSVGIPLNEQKNPAAPKSKYRTIKKPAGKSSVSLQEAIDAAGEFPKGKKPKAKMARAKGRGK